MIILSVLFGGLKLNELNFPANNGKQLAVNLTKGEQENGI
jgi:hypothetical protein